MGVFFLPAEIKISEQQILDAALAILQKDGLAALSARAVCKKLSCTARPIFRAFDSMDGLKKALLKSVKNIYLHRLNQPYESEYPFLHLGINYIQFAMEEKNLFSFLFMSGQIEVKSPAELISDNWNDVIGDISEHLKLNREDAKTLLLEVSILAHGMAVLIIMNRIAYRLDEIENLFLIAFEGIYKVLKEKGGTGK